jgi:rSAM/selenodomain-associated transferase 2
MSAEPRENAPRLSIVIPVLDEAEMAVAALERLAPLRRRGCELVVADGGSRDGTADLVRDHCDVVLIAPRGRGSQMNAGAAASRASALLFLHLDTQLPDGADAMILAALDGGVAWGRFDVTISGRHPLLPIVSTSMNLRSRLTGIATGDQALFMTRLAFDACGGFPDIPLMEDIVLSRTLKRLSRPACLAARVVTSGRRWDTYGAVRTILAMWVLRLAFCLGVDPVRLARAYGYKPRED